MQRLMLFLLNVFDINNYNEIRSNSSDWTAKRTLDGFCLDIIPIKQKNITDEEKDTAGIFMITSDVYLQDAAFYNFSPAGLAYWNLINHSNKTEDDLTVLSENTPIQNIRMTMFNGYNYYMGVEPDQTSFKGLHDGVHGSAASRNNTVNQPPTYNFSRPDSSSQTGYENVNYEVITYHVNMPIKVGSNTVIGQFAPDQQSGNIIYNLTPRVLGCYEVQNNRDGISYNTATGPKQVEFVWLVHYNFKIAYPTLKFTTLLATEQMRTIFDKSTVDVSYGWTNTITPQ